MQDPESAGAPIPPDEWEAIKDLVYEYQLHPPSELSAWLDANCPNAVVRREVERLVRSARTCGDFLGQPVAPKYSPNEADPPEKIGRYRIQEQLGSGGMGVVYAAFDDELNRRVAIKVLRDQAAFDPDQQKRLRWDAKTGAGLQHPNIVTVHEMGNDGGMAYVVMECIQGQTLGRLIPSAGMETADALRYAIQIASGLQAAHDMGIVHRDLKPGNVMVTDGSIVKLLDFGLAKQKASPLGGSETPTTIEGKFAGTVAYVSPEQAEGKAVDTRSDIFSFGTVLFEMLTGQRPFPGDSSLAILAKILNNEPESLKEVRPGVDPRLEEVIQRCLRKKRERRFQSIADVKVRLEEIEEGIRYAEQTRSGTYAIVSRASRGGVWWGVLIGATAMALAAAAGFWLTRPVEQKIIVRRVTHETGLAGSPAVSPDGTLLAYSSDRAGRGDLDIWVQQLGGGAPLPVTNSAADESDPAFAPDGTQLVYRSERDGGGIYLNSALGGSERLVAQGGRNPQFSPDGKWLAYWTGEAGGAFYPGTAKIWIIPAAGGAPRQFRQEFPAAALPLWSPDSKRLLFLARAPDSLPKARKVDWWVADLAGPFAQPTGLSVFLSGRGLQTPRTAYHIVPTAWLGSEGLVLFSAVNEDTTNIYSVHLTTDGKVSGKLQKWTGGTLVEAGASVVSSPEKTFFAFAATTQNTGIWRLPLDSAGHPAGPLESLVSGFDSASSPSLTADGSRLVFATRRLGGLFIQLKDLKSGEIKVVESVRTRRLGRAVMSGDGSTLVYADNPRAYATHLPNGTPRLLCELCGPPTYVTFDGRDILFESADSPERILISRDGQTPRPLLRMTAHPWSESAGRVSPDGQWLAFVRSDTESRNKSIWVAPMRPDGPVADDQLIRITDGDSSDLEPAWAPDGKRLYFLSDQNREIRARNLDPVTARPSGPVFPVMQFPHARRVIQGGSVYPGEVGLSVVGSSLVFALSDYSGDIWLQTITKQH